MSNLTKSKAAAYTLGVDWGKLAYVGLASGAAAHYITPWLLAVLLPVLVQQAATAWAKAQLMFAVREQQDVRREALGAQLDAFLRKQGGGE